MTVSHERIFEGIIAGLLLSAIVAGISWAVHSCGGGNGPEGGGTSSVTTSPPSPTSESPSAPSSTREPATGASTASPTSELSVPSVHASWTVTDCRLNRDYGHPQVTATVYVKNKDALNEHTYTLNVAFGDSDNRIATDYVYVSYVKPLETGKNQIIDNNPSAGAQSVPNGPISCRVTEITDYDTGAVVEP